MHKYICILYFIFEMNADFVSSLNADMETVNCVRITMCNIFVSGEDDIDKPVFHVNKLTVLCKLPGVQSRSIFGFSCVH